MFGQPHNVARSKSIEYEDLVQYADMGLWEACLKYDGQTKTSFQTYAINNIRWSVMDGLNRDCSLIKYNVNNLPPEEDLYHIESMDASVKGFEEGEESNHHDLIASDICTENTTLNKIRVTSTLRELSQREKDILAMKADGLTNIEIAAKFNVTPQAISKAHIRIREKMEGKDF